MSNINKPTKIIDVDGTETIRVSGKMKPKTSMLFISKEDSDKPYAIFKTGNGKFKMDRPTLT